MNPELLSLPWQLQLSLACGYAAYSLAYAGMKSHHQAIDIAFRTLVFSAMSAGASMLVAIHTGWGDVAASFAAVFVALAAGVLWRGWGRRWTRALLHVSRVTSADDELSAFNRLYEDTKHHVSQVIVTLSDGSELHCRDTSQFSNAPICPFVLGQDGSVLMYATHAVQPATRGEEELEVEYETVRDASWGDRLTLIPPNNVARIDLRLLQK